MIFFSPVDRMNPISRSKSNSSVAILGDGSLEQDHSISALVSERSGAIRWETLSIEPENLSLEGVSPVAA